MPDLQEVLKRIAEMAYQVEIDPAIPKGDRQWRKGYQQACSDIVIMLELLNQQQGGS